jgi:predicted phage tail protein
MITVILRGKLGKKFGKEWQLDVTTPARALAAINTLTRDAFFSYIEKLESEMQGYHVQIGKRKKRTIGESLLDFQFVGETVTITPLLQGADTKGVVQIVAGVALIAVGIAAVAGTFGTGSIGGISIAMLGVQAIGLGLAVSLGGVARLLISAPDATLGNQDKTKSSYIFTGAVNTVQQGECVPIAYGEVICGSAVVSAAVESEDIT